MFSVNAGLQTHRLLGYLFSCVLQWFKFDDERVVPVSEEQVLQADAYCLFYWKMSPSPNCTTTPSSLGRTLTGGSSSSMVSSV